MSCPYMRLIGTRVPVPTGSKKGCDQEVAGAFGSPPLLTEEDFHAYLDGELAEHRRSFVEAHLSEHPDDAQRLAAYGADGAAIARIFSGS